MTIDSKKWVSVMVRHQLTPSQFLFLYLLYSNDIPDLYYFLDKGPPIRFTLDGEPVEAQGFHESEIRDLEQRGYVVCFNPSRGFETDNFAVTAKFRSEMEDDEGMVRAEAFWETFPDWIFIPNRVAGKSCSKEALLRAYYYKIAIDKQKHELVMAALHYANEKKLIQMGILKWFESEQWKIITKEQSIRKGKVALPGERIL